MDRMPAKEEPQRPEEAPQQELARPGSAAQQPAATRAALTTPPQAAVERQEAATVEPWPELQASVKLRPELREAATPEPRPELREAATVEPRPELRAVAAAERREAAAVEPPEATLAELGPLRAPAVRRAVLERRAVQDVVRAARPGRGDPSLVWAVRHK